MFKIRNKSARNLNQTLHYMLVPTIWKIKQHVVFGEYHLKGTAFYRL